MNEIVITGSTGVIGQRAVRELLAAGHGVTGVTRSARGRERLEALGARAVDADVFDEASLRRRLESLPDWYREALARGGVVEELVSGEGFTSPSVQVDIRPGGSVQVLATHEQVLGGVSGQVYMGCRFPAEPAYAPLLAEHGRRAGAALAGAGALGRFSLDFAVVLTPGGWRVAALEINLRKGGTTHPYTCLRNLVPVTPAASASSR